MSEFFGVFENFFCKRLCFTRARVIMVFMNKPMKIALAAALAIACVGVAAWEVRAEAAETAGGDTALFLPGSYEQYLELSAPADAAVSEHYLAVADGKNIYIYDREAGGSYRVYTHLPGSSMPITISKIQFTEDERLYFADSAQEFYELDLRSLTPSSRLLSLSTFYIEGSSLYAVTVALSSGTTIYKLSLNGPLSIAEAESSQLLALTPTTPSMTFGGGVLYCAVNGTAFPYNGQTLDPLPNFRLDKNFGLLLDTASVCAAGDDIYYTDTRGLQRTDANGNSEVVFEGENFTALTSFRNMLYCVKGATVREISLETEEYTGYEIGAASDSPNRLSAATDSVRGGNLLVTADSGNRRVSVYDMKAGTYSVLACNSTPSAVATDGEMIAVCCGRELSLYHAGETAPYYQHTAESELKGAACVYGRCYFVTEHSYGVAEAGAREFTRSHSPVALTNDMYGNLYVADQQNLVTAFTESEFLDREAEGRIVTNGWILPAGFRSLRADYEGGLYYLDGTSLCRNGSTLASFNADEFLYRKESSVPASPVSVALGFEDNAVYLQYGNYMLRSEKSFPTLSSIDAAGVHGDVFSVPDRETVSFVTVSPSAVGIFTDLNQLTEESGAFACTGHARVAGGTAILLAEKDKFCLVALYEDHGYRTALFLEDDCTPLSVRWTDSGSETRYVSSEVAFSYYPCLADSLTIARLPRAANVTVLARITLGGRGFDFAYAEWNGIRGYIPTAYLTESDPAAAQPDVYTLGYLKENAEGTTFYAEGDDSDTIVVTDRTQVRVYDTQSDFYEIKLVRDGKVYRAQVRASALERGDSDALRMSIIIILSVLAVGIVTAYALLITRKKK